MYHEGTKPIVSEYVERISAFGKVSQKFGNNFSFLQKYQLYQISTLPKFTLHQKTLRKKAPGFFWFLVGDFNISGLFYKTQNSN